MIDGLILYIVLIFGKCEITVHETYSEMTCDRDYRRVFFPKEAEALEWFKSYDWSEYHMTHLIRGEMIEAWEGPTQWKDGEP
ncbi:MAG: hypothetical protein V3R16_02615 [Nitrospirales bacterium]